MQAAAFDLEFLLLDLCITSRFSKITYMRNRRTSSTTIDY